jgi:ribosome-associated protein
LVHNDPDQPLRDEDQPSRSALKRDAKAVAALGDRLLALPADRLEQLDLDEELSEAIATFAGLRKSAIGRQRRLIAQLLRDRDPNVIERRLERATAGLGRPSRKSSEDESWCERLIGHGDAALTELLDQHPDADRQRLRQLIRNAKRAPDGPKAARARQRLLQAIRAVRH